MKIINEMVVRAVLAFGLIGMSQAVLAEQRVLNADEVAAMFSDKTVWGEHAFKEKKTMSYFSADGSFTGKQLDINETTKGKWSVYKKGRLFLERGGDNLCRKVVDDGGVIKKYKKKKHVFTYTKFEDGNKL